MWHIIYTIFGVAIINIAALVIIFRLYMPNMIQTVLDDVGESFSENFKEIMVDPTVKRGFGLAGKLSGEARGVKAVTNKIAEGIIDQNPLIKIVAEKLGFPLDEMMDQYGAETVMQAISKFQPILQGLLGSTEAKTLNSESKLP